MMLRVAAVAACVAGAQAACKDDYLNAYLSANTDRDICNAVKSLIECQANSPPLGADATAELDAMVNSARTVTIASIDCVALVPDFPGELSARELKLLQLDAQGPKIASVNGGIDMQVRQGEDVTFERLRRDSASENAFGAQLNDLGQ